MKTTTIKTQLENANRTIAFIFSDVVSDIGTKKALELILAGANKELIDLDKSIKNEQTFADENKTGAYRDAGAEARKQIKRLKNIRKEEVKAIKSLEQFINLRNKIEEELLK